MNKIRTVNWIIIMILLSIFLSCASTKQIQIDSKEAEYYNSRGETYFEEGRLDEAIRDFNKALELNPRYAQVYNNRGVAHGRKGELDLAIFDLNKALELNPGYAEAYSNRGVAHSRKGQWDLAIADLNKALELDSGHHNAYNKRGAAYYEQGKYDQAIVDFNKALELSPEHAEAYNNRGVVHRQKGQMDQAIADFNKALELDSKDAAAYYNRGLAHYDIRNYEKSLKDVLMAKELGFQAPPSFLDELREASSEDTLKGSNAHPWLITAAQDKLRQQFYPNCSEIKTIKVLDIQPPEMKGKIISGSDSWTEKWKISACGITRIHSIEFKYMEWKSVKGTTHTKRIVNIEVKEAE